MPRRVPPLTDFQVSKAKPRDRDYKLTDGGGLYLLVTMTGGKLWRLKYRFAGKEKLLAIGPYPEISLSDARMRREEARRLIANATDPAEIKKAARETEKEQRANTFEKLALEWHERQVEHLAERTRKMIMRRLKRDAFPVIGDTPLTELSSRLILEKVLRPIEDRGAID